MLGRANAGREWLCADDESPRPRMEIAKIWALLGAKSLAMCGSAVRGDAIASDSGGM